MDMPGLTSHQLYKWVTEDMGYFPKKISGASRSVVTSQDLEFMMESNTDLWNHVIKHVHPVSKVQHVRKNILLARLKKNKLLGIQKSDEVSETMQLLSEVKQAEVKLQKCREEARECEKLLENQKSLLNYAGCQRTHLQNTLDNIERRCILLKMSGDTIQALRDTCDRTSRIISSEKASRTAIIASNASDEESVDDQQSLMLSQSSSTDCKRFLAKCLSKAKDLLDEESKIVKVNLAAASRNSSEIFDCSQFSLDSKSLDFQTPRVPNSIFETKEKELKSFINNNVLEFSAHHLFDSLLSMISEEKAKTLASCPDHYSSLDQKIYGKERVEELEDLLSEKLMYFDTKISHELTVAAQEREVTLRMMNEFRELMIKLEKDLIKKFPDNAMQDKIYELVNILRREASIGGALAFLKTSLNDLKTSDKSTAYQMKKLNEQLGTMEDEMVCCKGFLKYFLNIRRQIDNDIMGNHNTVSECLLGMTMRNTFGDVEKLIELFNQEFLMFNEHPMELHNQLLFMENKMLDSELFMNVKEGSHADWLKLLGMTPYSSAEFVTANLLKVKGLVELFRGSTLNVENEMLQNAISKIPGLLKCLEEDEKKSDIVAMETCDFVRMERSQTEKEIEKANSMYNIWWEGKVDQFVSESELFEGKNFLHWYYAVQSAM